MKKYILLALVVLILGCAKAPITGRRQLLLVGKEEVYTQSNLQYDKVLEESIILNNSDTQMVRRVGEDIARAVEEFLSSQPEYAHMADDFDWEFNLIESDQVNAWCMPGGKVAFYTGILPYTEDENGLAVVMGHEIAHAVADHGRERMSQELLRQYGGATLAEVLGEDVEAGTNIFLEAYGAGTNLIGLKYSRDHEKEADKLGVIFMALAGYNPEEAVDFWARMAADKTSEPLEFFSTHPNSDTRIQLIREYISSEEFRQYSKE